MTTWIQTSNIHQDGTPVTRRIKLESYDSEVWFTTNAYAEVADSVADILATTIGHIEELQSDPVDPGDYYGDAGHHETIRVQVPDGVFDDVSAQVVNASELSVNANQVYVQDTPPENPTEDDVWIDTRGF